MKLKTVLHSIDADITACNDVHFDLEQSCGHITAMYQDIKAGESVFALKHSENFRRYFKLALDKRPALIITDLGRLELKDMAIDVPVVYIKQYETAANRLVKLFYGASIARMKYIAVTGTNGKTTTCHMIGRLLAETGQKAAIIGTLGVFDADYQKIQFRHSTRTTPMHFELGEMLDFFANENYDYVVYEATSIGLDQRRTDALPNDMAVFTNFSEEHLEYHGTMQDYLAAKLRLAELSKDTLVNLDTPEYGSIIEAGRHFSRKTDAFYQFGIHNSHVDLIIGGQPYVLKPKFQGGHNYINIATSIFALHKLGFCIDDLLAAAENIEPPVHRFQMLDFQGYTIILDFAHTALAVKESIDHALKLAGASDKRLNVMVTGIGMRGFDKIASTMEKVPRGVHKLMLSAEQIGYENPDAIIGFMLKHLPTHCDDSIVVASPSRKEGIRKLLGMTDREEEIILLTGINEPQHYRGKIEPHDDRSYIQKILN